MCYFGCWDTPGHFLYLESGRNCWKSLQIIELVFPDIDGGYCVGTDPNRERAWQRPEEQPEGIAKITHKEGWTMLSFWDRSVDKRMNCNSNFIQQGDFSFEQMVESAQLKFPKIWERFTFEVKLHE